MIKKTLPVWLQTRAQKGHTDSEQSPCRESRSSQRVSLTPPSGLSSGCETQFLHCPIGDGSLSFAFGGSVKK